MNKNTEKSLEQIFQPISTELKSLEAQLENTFSKDNSLVNQIARYTINSGGKRLRPAIVFLFGGLCGEINREHYELAKAVELIHNATLIHDDIIDEASLRRNNKTIHCKWDTKTAILSGDFLLAKALKSLTSSGDKENLRIFSYTLESICEGEIEQSLNSDIFSLDDYIKRAERKTALLFSAASQCAASSNKDKASEYAKNLGISFQIIDDLLVFKQGKMEKTEDSDFNNNLLTAPVLFAIEEGIHIDFDSDFAEFKQKILNSEAIEKSYALAKKYCKKAQNCLEFFNKNKYSKSLYNLTEYIIDREF